jgi:hypothetical protein
VLRDARFGISFERARNVQRKLLSDFGVFV